MGRNQWNPQRWHRNHVRPRRRNPMWGPALVVALALLTGGVAATQGASLDATSDRVGICHATGDAQNPYVYLVIDRNGVDHGHHAAHAGDMVDVSSEADCAPITTTQTSTGEGTACGPSDTEAGAGAAHAHSDQAADAAHAQGANETAPHDPDLAGLCDADVAVTHTAHANGSWVAFELRVDSVGTGEANDVLLDASLPDVGRAWRILGTAPGCLLEARELSCEFGDLAAGASRTVTVKAPRCAEDCGDDLEASGVVRAYNDANATNNREDAILVVEDCPRGPTTPTTTPSAAPTTSPAPANPTTSPTSQPSGNATNHTGGPDQPASSNTTGPANTSEPAPAAGDASVAQRADQNEEQVLLTIVVRSVGDGNARNVSLMDTLPDVRRAWHLSGADAGQCTLDGRWLNCWFGDLDAGTSRTITLKAYTDRLACGQHLTNNVTVAATGDQNAYNNRSGASIEARAC